jgi:hypothetical protein
MEQWREVDEKEFFQFLNILDLQPMSGYSTSFGSATRYGREDIPDAAELYQYSDLVVYKIKQGSK